METPRQFTCISYDTMDFLVPTEYVASGIFLSIPREERKIIFNRETLPHIFIGTLLEREFGCSSSAESNVVLVMNMKDFQKDVAKLIVDFTDTAFPASGHLALSVNAPISSGAIALADFHLFPEGIRERLSMYGMDAILFQKSGRKQVLISPDLLLRKFFSGGRL